MDKPKEVMFGHIFAFKTYAVPSVFAFAACQSLTPHVAWPGPAPAPLRCQCRDWRSATSTPGARHGSRATPAPVFFLVILIRGLGKDGLEQHVLSLSVFNGRTVCPSQLMGTRTCRGVHPPHSAAATASQPAGALRS